MESLMRQTLLDGPGLPLGLLHSKRSDGKRNFKFVVCGRSQTNKQTTEREKDFQWQCKVVVDDYHCVCAALVLLLVLVDQIGWIANGNGKYFCSQTI